MIPAPNSGVLAHEARIDQLDVNAAVLHRLDRARDLDQLAGGGVRIGVRAGFTEFHFALVLVSARPAALKQVAVPLPRRPSGAGKMALEGLPVG